MPEHVPERPFSAITLRAEKSAQLICQIFNISPSHLEPILSAYEIVAPFFGADASALQTKKEAKLFKNVQLYCVHELLEQGSVSLSLLRNVIAWHTEQNTKTHVSTRLPVLIQAYRAHMFQNLKRILEVPQERMPCVAHSMQHGKNQYVLQALVTKGSRIVESACRDHCIGRSRGFATDNIYNKETGLPESEYFSVRKTWQSATKKERRRYVKNLLKETLANEKSLYSAENASNAEKTIREALAANDAEKPLVALCKEAIERDDLPLTIPLFTLSYNVRAQKIDQISGYQNREVRPHSKDLPALAEALGFLIDESHTYNVLTGETEKRIITEIDIKFINEEWKVLLRTGKVLDNIDDAAIALHAADIIAGHIGVMPSMSPDTVQKLALRPITLDLTDATSQQLAAIEVSSAYLIHEGEDVTFPNLTTMYAASSFGKAKTFIAPKLEYIDPLIPRPIFLNPHLEVYIKQMKKDPRAFNCPYLLTRPDKIRWFSSEF